MSEIQNFLLGYIEGEYLAEEIDDFIEQWHTASKGVPLYEYLGFTEDEWEIWLVDDSTLPQIAIARSKNIPLPVQLERAQEYAMAARSDKPLEAQQVIEWLRKHGHLQ